MNNLEIATYIDHTLLKPDSSKEDISNICSEAKKYKFASVCINPCWVSLAKEELKNSKVKVCTVIGFPLGANTTNIKVLEAKEAIENGASEIDMVINIGKIKSDDWDYVENDIKSVVNQSKTKAIVKVIIEACLLSNEEKIKACKTIVSAGANFVKTSTGFSLHGAKLEDVELMRKVVGKDFGVKASGGVRDRETALNFINAGANRIGTSSGVKIVTE